MDSIKQYGTLITLLGEAHESLDGAGKVDPERGAEGTKTIITGAKKKLMVLGINALRPAHEGIEPISKILDSGGDVYFTMLDPFSNTFAEREKFEKTAAGRLRLELSAAVAGLADAYKRAGKRGYLRLYLHDRWPLLSVVAADFEGDDGEMQLNLYPDKEGNRGLKGRTYQLSADGLPIEQDAFVACIDFLYALNQGSTIAYPNNFAEILSKSQKMWLEKYAGQPL